MNEMCRFLLGDLKTKSWMCNSNFAFQFVCLGVIGCVLYSCQMNQRESDEVQKIDIPIGSSTHVLKLSEFADDVECIPLETNDSTILDKIIRIIDEGDYLCVADKHSLYKFDKLGKVCGKITKEGIGPNEYIQISDFQVTTGGSVWILSRNNKCLYHFEWDGTLIHKIELNFWTSKIYLVDDNTMLLYIGNEKDMNNSHQVKLLDLKSAHIKRNYLPVDDKKSSYMHVMSDNYFYRENDSIYFFQVFCDTVYSITKDTIAPEYFYNLADKNIPKSFFSVEYKNVMDFFQHLSKERYAYGINFFLKSLNYSLMSYYYDGECYLSVISNNKGSSKIGNQISADLVFSNYPITLNELAVFLSPNQKMIIPLIPDDIIEYARNTLDEKEQAILENRINYSGSDQNVVLLKMKIK